MVARRGAAGLPDVAPTGLRRFSARNNRLCSGVGDGTARVWRPEERERDRAEDYAVEDDDFYIDSLDEDCFKEALKGLSESGANALVITNAAKKYLAQQPREDEGVAKPTKSAPASRRPSRDVAQLPSDSNVKLDFLTVEPRSRSAGSSPNGCQFRKGKGKSAGSSRGASPKPRKSARSRLVKRKVKTPDGKHKTEYSFVYDKSVHSLHHDQKWQQETTLGKRVALYKLQGELGRGNFSTVKLGIHELTKERVAVKILDKSKLTPKAKKMLVREIANMEAIHHKNLIRLFEVVETLGKLHLVMEFVAGGELYRKLTTEGKMKELDAKNAFAQILSGVRHLHERNIVHRDIKAENVFCGPRGIVKLGDFGFSTRVTGIQLAVWGDQLKTFCGSPPYAAPELFRDESYAGRPVDVWALGVLLFFMTTGHMPFPADSIGGLKRTILLGVITAPAHLSLPCRTLIRGILQQNPKDRFSLDQIASSEWMQGLATTGGACERYVLTPTIGVPPEQLATEEKLARARLEALGITSAMLEQEVVQGARSPIIASYRIVVNRVHCSSQHPYVPPTKPPKSKTCVIL